MMCNMDCLNCIYPDCINDSDVTPDEMKAQDELDKKITYGRAKEKGRVSQWKYNHSEAGKEAQKRYVKSEKGKEAHKRYAKSEKGKQAKERYIQSDKGKEAEKRRKQKQIASGKNAEYCRRYYARKKGLAV